MVIIPSIVFFVISNIFGFFFAVWQEKSRAEWGKTGVSASFPHRSHKTNQRFLSLQPRSDEIKRLTLGCINVGEN